MSLPDDALLRAAFHDLRTAEIAAAPRWREVSSDRLKPVLTLAIFRPVAALAVMLIVIASLVAAIRTIPADPIPAVTASWEGPTDFLLKTPQMDLLETVPQFGERTLAR